MSLVPQPVEDPTMDDLCEGCGREPDSCNCPPVLDDDFEPLEDGYDPDWDDYPDD